MNVFVRIPFAICLAMVLAMPAGAATYRVDDSGSQVLGSTLRLKPEAPVSRNALATRVSGEIAVLTRLDVAAWTGKQGRIYMTLPEQPGGTITASWTTRGRLLPGVLRSGERALVYAGPIQSDRIEDTLRLRIEADGRRLSPTAEQLAFSFEIDIEGP